MRIVSCSLLFAAGLALAACGDSTRQVVDAKDDAPTDAPTDAPGGSAFAWNLDPSPKDHDLEIAVLALSVVVAGGPIGVRQRRRRRAL